MVPLPGGLTLAEVDQLLDCFGSRARRRGLKSFVTLAKTICEHGTGMPAVVRPGVHHELHKALNRHVATIRKHFYDFDSARVTIALGMLT